MRYAVITGAAGGIGRAIVEAFAAAGHAVIATDRAPQPAGLPCSLYIEADLARTVAEEDYAAQVFARIADHVGGGDLGTLVNNAAIQVLGGAATLGRDDWRRTLDVNLLAPFFWTQALLPALERAGGSVVNISSIHARLTKGDFVAYATSKAALSGMTRALAVDVGSRVRVNAIEPAAIATDMLKAGFAEAPQGLAQLAACHPAGRIGEPGEVAGCALFLASDAARFLNGSTLGLDGGIAGRLMDPA